MNFFNPQPKPQRENDKKYLAYIRTLPCLIGGCTGKAVPHHESGLSDDPSMAMKCSDYLAVPMCLYHHDKRHTIGFKTFWKIYRIDPRVVVDRLRIGYKIGCKKLKTKK